MKRQKTIGLARIKEVEQKLTTLIPKTQSESATLNPAAIMGFAAIRYNPFYEEHPTLNLHFDFILHKQ